MACDGLRILLEENFFEVTVSVVDRLMELGPSVGEVKKNQRTVWWCEEENFGVKLSYDSDLSQMVGENYLYI